MTRLLVFLCAISPPLRRVLWRWWYNKLAKRVATERWTFMNYGFQPIEASTLALPPEDEPDRCCIQLYERVTGEVDLAGAKVVGVGSGRGGGASYIARYRRPESMLGVDYSREAIALSTARHRAVAHLSFVAGDAENLPLPEAAFDDVINVESSHCYGNVPKFFGEVARVLRPGGHFLFADLREPAEMEELRQIFQQTPGLEIVKEEDITAGVVAALEIDDTRKRALIASLVPASLRPLFEEFAGLREGQVHSGLKNRALLYYRFVARRI